MDNNQAVVVTIGRNVGNEPLSDERWSEYQQAIRFALRDFVALVPGGFFTVDGNLGQGFWDGVAEDNCVFVIVAPEPTDEEQAIAGFTAGRYLACALAHVAFDFGQESVAVCGGPSYLVPAHEDAVRVAGREAAEAMEAFLRDQEGDA